MKKIICLLMASAIGSTQFTNIAMADVKIYQSVSSFFGSNGYGTLALNIGALDSRRNKSQFAFRPIKLGDPSTIPFQSAYCFVVAHFGGSPIGAEHNYNFKRYSISTDGKRTLVGGLPPNKTYDITKFADTKKMPSYCFKNTHPSGTKFQLKVSSSDGDWFDGTYTFLVE